MKSLELEALGSEKIMEQSEKSKNIKFVESNSEVVRAFNNMVLNYTSWVKKECPDRVVKNAYADTLLKVMLEVHKLYTRWAEEADETASKLQDACLYEAARKFKGMAEQDRKCQFELLMTYKRVTDTLQ